MTKNKKAQILLTTNFDELLQVKYGQTGTKTRDAFKKKLNILLSAKC